MAERREKELKLEEIFEQLEATLEKLDKEELSLEESFQAYEQGVRLVKAANERIDRVEKQVLVLNGKGELDGFSELAEDKD